MSEEEQKTAEPRKKTVNKNLLVAIGGLLIAVIVVVLLFIFVGGGMGGLNEGWFVSDDTKLVLTIESNPEMVAEDESIPINSHMVYTYSGDNITGFKIYYQYSDNEKAKKACETISANNSIYENVEQNGRYVVMTEKAEDYQYLKTSDIKQQIDFMNMYNSNNNQSSSSNTETTESNE